MMIHFHSQYEGKSSFLAIRISRMQALGELSDVGVAAKSALALLYVLVQNTADEEIRAKATRAAVGLTDAS